MRSAVENWLAHVRRAVAVRLEAGAGPRLPTVQLDPVRALTLPARPVIGVGGALLGGSGRTPLSLAIAEYLGARAAWIGRGYPIRRRTAHRVTAHDDAASVGDEAVLAYRRLTPHGVAVWIGPREATLHAAEAEVLVVDGLLQARPARLALSVLALSGREPWGSGRLLPRGDLRARPSRLVALADHVAWLSPSEGSVQHAPFAERVPTRLVVPADVARLGLFTALARPARILEQLEAAGVSPAVALHAHDHAPASWHPVALELMARHALLGFLVTEKCDAALGALELPRSVLRYELALPRKLRAHIDRLVAPSLAETARRSVSP